MVSGARAYAVTAAPRLTRLELHGFKSFAGRTVFTFEPGITAVIGPNGSGKSNISDAVRWVLGEQSHGALRSKRTEDVIFAGGQGRAPAGMAEVAVTFDNSDHWLPTEFAEVTITRRAYRAGDQQSQYLINGRRVRLKDVAQLTASLGQSYTVVGQGLVDAALSQRAEERRRLFEHAADLTGLRLKAAEAERSLAEAEANSARLDDLLLELEPRLKTLERAARQAREWQALRERLRALQRAHEGHLLRMAHQTLTQAVAVAATGAAATRAALAEVERLVSASEAARVAAEEARAALARDDARMQSVTDQLRRMEHERDLAAERLAALGRRRDDMADTQGAVEAQVAMVETELATAAPALAALTDECAAARAATAALRAAGAAAHQERTRLERAVTELAATLSVHERQAADLVRRRALLEQRQVTDAAEQERAVAQLRERTTRIAALDSEIAGAAETARTDASELAALDGTLADLAEQSERATETAERAREAAFSAERRLGEATTRLEVLQRLHESGAGLFAGVRETLRAGRAGDLTGIRGTVAELLDVPPVYDTAIEVALGGHMQDIVVERWADAEAAIAALKRANAGRATFQPLETVRSPANQGEPREALRLDGVHGIAATLVTASPELGNVIAALLGRTLVVDDLAVARAVLPQLPAGWQAVTLSGEIARGGGSVTGGAAVRESGVLRQSRELRDLPAEVRRLEQARAAAVAGRQAAAEEPRRLAAARQAAEAARAGQVAAQAERQAHQRRLAGWLAEQQSERATTERRINALAISERETSAALTMLAGEDAALADATVATRDAHEAALAAVAQATASAADEDRMLAVEQQRLAALEERLEGERRRHAGLHSRAQSLAEELVQRRERAAALDEERAALTAQHERLTRDVTELDHTRGGLGAARAPRAASARQAEADAATLVRALDAARTTHVERERAQGAGDLAVERARGEMATVRQRIRDELELADPDLLLAEEPPAPLPPGIERQIATLKERLRRIGYVGEEVIAEYEREAERQGFLRGQLRDIHGAATALRSLLADLHATMRDRFDATFTQVADAFAEAFATLFGGGTARLVLTGGEDGAPPGIDIVAQPPGKRLQSLALLSGGERALTAAALLFAILRVNPTPFCLLDEVDAALDEANIVRFREQLRILADETQVIVITHNRGTIEIADTLYGVSMGDDGVSQILSLRLAEAVAG